MGSQNTRTRVKRPSMHAWYVYSLLCIKYHIIKNICISLQSKIFTRTENITWPLCLSFLTFLPVVQQALLPWRMGGHSECHPWVSLHPTLGHLVPQPNFLTALHRYEMASAELLTRAILHLPRPVLGTP